MTSTKQEACPADMPDFSGDDAPFPAMPSASRRFTTAEQRARLRLPSWLTDAEIEEHGAGFLTLFKDRGHFDHYLATGSLSHPRNVRDQLRRKERRQADPIYARREELGRAVSAARRNLKSAEARLAKHVERFSAPWRSMWTSDERERERLTSEVVQRRAALAAAEVELEPFTRLHEQQAVEN